MVRNSKRKAFTIVELVIVIAVIAILAAVMIPTFGGVIDSANLSADKQLLSTVNTQLSIYTGLGNKIETEADLWKALKGDFNGGSDLTAKFDPKSANKGYHYWYNIAKEQVELLKYDEEKQGLLNANTGKMMLRADSVARAITGNGFASSPRCFGGSGESQYNFYFLDTGSNAFAEFFKYIENLSTTDTSDYADKHNAATTLGGDNAALAAQLKDKMAKTAILTDKPAIVGSTNINYVYIPENKTEDTDEYYLNHTGTTTINATVSVTIVIPENVKLGDGCLDAFGAVNVEVDVDDVKKLEDVFSGSAISVEATVIVNGAEYKVDGKDVFHKDDTKEDGKGNKVEDVALEYRNQVTTFVPQVNGNVVNSCIAVDKAMNQNEKIDLNLLAQSGSIVFTDADLPKYEKIVWTVEASYANYVEIKDGKVSFKDTFNKDCINDAGTITFTGTPVAAKDATANKTITLKFVTLSDAKVEFKSDDAAVVTTKLSEISAANLMVNFYGTSNTYFSNIKDFVYVAKDGTQLSGEAIATLGCAAHELVVSTDTANGYFSVSDNKLNFVPETVKGLNGRMDTQTVTVKVVNSNAKDEVSKVATIKVSDNQGSPFAVQENVTKYTNHVYNVGNVNAITLELLFKEVAATVGNGNLSQYKILICDDEPANIVDENETVIGTKYYPMSNSDKHVIALGERDWKTIELTADSFTDALGVKTGKRWVVVVANVDDNGETVIENKTLAVAPIDVVDGLNIFKGGEANFINSTNDNKGTSDTADDRMTVTNGTQSVVLHSDLDFANTKTENNLRTLQGANIWGNYYTIKAKTFKDSDRNTNNGYGMIHVSSGNNTINQLIIDGPTYAAPATSAANIIDNNTLSKWLGDFNTNQYGNFCNGINVGANLTINDSYIFGFNSPVRVNGGDFVANRTVFEGGAWSNIFLANATTFQLNGCMTIQDHNGYQATVDDTSKKVLGFGIYVHDTMNNNKGKDGKALKLELELNNTKQYNWLSEADKSNGGLLFEYAMGEIFGENGIAHGQGFFHQTNYVNAAILSMGARLKGLVNKELTAYTDNYEVGGSVGSKYTAQKVQDETEITIVKYIQSAYVRANVYSYQCGTDCDCGSKDSGIGFTYSISQFLADQNK